MSTTIVAPSGIYTGFWHDKVGASLTLTTSSSAGVYLIAFLALFVRLAGNHSWNLICYATFLVRSTSKPKDGLFHQQQLVLRSGLSDGKSVSAFAMLGFAWKNKARGALGRTLPLMLAAALQVVIFTLCGIFSSKVTRPHSNVLVRKSTCGDAALDPTDVLQVVQYESTASIARMTAATYVEQCYLFNQSSPGFTSPFCDSYGREHLQWTIDTTIGCPFDEEMCLDGFAVRFDSGYIDSSQDLGINAARDNRVKLGTRLECAPIVTDGFQTDLVPYNETGLPSYFEQVATSDSAYIAYNYGPNPHLYANTTFVWDNNTWGNSLGIVPPPPFALFNVVSFPGASDDGPVFHAIPQLDRPDSQVDLFFLLQNILQYVEPVHDPWLSATDKITFIDTPISGPPQNVTIYTPHAPVSVLGCKSQWQFCNPNYPDTPNGRCTQWNASTSSKYLARDELNLNAKQTEVMLRMYKAFGNNWITNTFSELGNNGLLASQQIINGKGSTLPNDQWIRELDHAFGVMLTAAQIEISRFPRGNGFPTTEQHLSTPDANASWMCDSQIIQRDDFISFNMSGVIVILVVGGALIILDMLLHPIVRFLEHQRRKKKSSEHSSTRIGDFNRVGDWDFTSIYHTQAFAYQALGLGGTWKNRVARIPTTENSDEEFGPIWMRFGDDEKTHDDRSSDDADSGTKPISPSAVDDIGTATATWKPVPAVHTTTAAEEIETVTGSQGVHGAHDASRAET